MSVTRVRIGVATAVIGMLLPPLQVSHALAGDRASSSADSAPAIVTPDTGHFHVLAAPTRVISTATGKGLAKKPGPAGASRVLTIGGHGGGPVTGIRAVAITITAVAPAGPTQLWADKATPRPVVPTLATGGATISAFSIVPV